MCVQVAAEVLQGGGVVAVPTDTIYGLACLVQHPAAVDRLYTIKVNSILSSIFTKLSESLQL